MEIDCAIIELKPNSHERVREWASHILKNKGEAVETLKNEGVTIESFFLVEIEDKDYLIGYMRAKSREKAQEVVKKSLSEIDAYHQKFKKDTWVRSIQSELMFDLSRIEGEDEIA